ncbi:MAG: biotin/lipoyl-binding protein [Candidatus Thorarchaeota archaeon]|nr:MAG: biotin/lipoyl-binding protein [Candidatus Thorarchaeota archaeon]
MLDEGGLLIVKVGDETFTLKTAVSEDGTWTINDTSTDHQARIIRRAGRKATIELNEEEVEIVWDRVRQQEDHVATGGAIADDKRISGGIYPPMPGKITEVKVRVGDSVQAGDTVCILEAMKMFNELKAPSDGQIKEVNIEPGSSVTPSDLLILVE